MKKRNFLLALLFLMIALTPLCTVSCKKQRTFENGTLYLNDNFVTDDHIYISSDGVAKLSIVDVFESLGVGIEYESDNLIRVTYDEKEFYLNIAEKALYREGDSRNWILIPPGSKVFSAEVIDGKLIVESAGIRATLQVEFGIFVRFNVDEENLKVTMIIEEKSLEK